MACAQDFTRLDVEGSTDNVVWSSQGLATQPGATLYFRVKATKVGPTPVAGFASLSFQPIVESPAGQPQAFSVLPLTNATTGAGTLANGGTPANLGRLLPFASTSMTAASAPGLLTSFLGSWSGRSILRYAGSRNSTPTTNLSWGVQASQTSPAVSGTNFVAATNAVLFKFAVTFSATANGFYWIDAPHALLASQDAPSARWYTVASGAGAPRPFIVDPGEIKPFFVYVGGNPCLGGGGAFTRDPLPINTVPGRRAVFEAPALVCVSATYQWKKNGVPIAESSRIRGTTSNRLLLDPVLLSDAGSYSCHAMFETIKRETLAASLAVRCPADLDDGSFLGTRDDAVNVNDLLYFLAKFEQGTADIDDGSFQAIPDGAVTVDDLLYFLDRFEVGC